MGRHSILPAPLLMGLAAFPDFAQRAGLGGIQEWLTIYYKARLVFAYLDPEHGTLIWLTKLKNTTC